MGDEKDRNLYDGVPSGIEPGHRFIVDLRENCIDDHDLWIGGDRYTGRYVCLQRGFLEEFSKASVVRIRGGLNALTQGNANFYMDQNRISYHDLAIVLAQARIKEMQGFENHLVDELGELRGKVMDYEDARALRARLDAKAD